MFRIKNQDNGVVLISLLLIVNVFQTCCDCWLWTGRAFPDSYWKDKHFWRQDRSYHALCCSILLTNSIWTYTFTNLRWIGENFLRNSLLQTLIMAKKMRLTFKITCCTCFLLKILLAGRLIRSYFTQQFQYPFTQMSGFSLTWITNSHELKIFELCWIMWENKKITGWKSMLRLDKIDSLTSIG